MKIILLIVFLIAGLINVCINQEVDSEVAENPADTAEITELSPSVAANESLLDNFDSPKSDDLGEITTENDDDLTLESLNEPPTEEPVHSDAQKNIPTEHADLPSIDVTDKVSVINTESSPLDIHKDSPDRNTEESLSDTQNLTEEVDPSLQLTPIELSSSVPENGSQPNDVDSDSSEEDQIVNPVLLTVNDIIETTIATYFESQTENTNDPLIEKADSPPPSDITDEASFENDESNSENLEKSLSDSSNETPQEDVISLTTEPSSENHESSLSLAPDIVNPQSKDLEESLTETVVPETQNIPDESSTIAAEKKEITLMEEVVQSLTTLPDQHSADTENAAPPETPDTLSNTSSLPPSIIVGASLSDNSNNPIKQETDNDNSTKSYAWIENDAENNVTQEVSTVTNSFNNSNGSLSQVRIPSETVETINVTSDDNDISEEDIKALQTIFGSFTGIKDGQKISAESDVKTTIKISSPTSSIKGDKIIKKIKIKIAKKKKVPTATLR